MGEIKKMRKQSRLKRKTRVRKKISGTLERPRLTVFRSNRFIYAQLVNDDEGRTLACSSSRLDLGQEVAEGLAGKCALAYQVGRDMAEKAKEKGIAKIVFDRSGYLYHGRVAALAKGVRDGGIEF